MLLCRSRFWGCTRAAVARVRLGSHRQIIVNQKSIFIAHTYYCNLPSFISETLFGFILSRQTDTPNYQGDACTVFFDEPVATKSVRRNNVNLCIRRRTCVCRCTLARPLKMSPFTCGGYSFLYSRTRAKSSRRIQIGETR